MIIFTLYPTALRLPSGCNTAEPTLLAHKTAVIEAFDLGEISALTRGESVALLCETQFGVAEDG